MIRKILLGCGIVSSVLYVVSDVVGALLYPGYSYADQEFSELLAAGSPVRTRMIALNGIPYGVLVVAFAVGVWTSARPKLAARITGGLLIAYAVIGSVTGISFPMDTREVLATGQRTLHNAIHGPGTAVMSLFLVLAMGFGSRLLGRRFRYYTYATIAALVVFGEPADRPDGGKPTDTTDGADGAHQHLRHHALGGGAGYRSLARQEGSIIPVGSRA